MSFKDEKIVKVLLEEVKNTEQRCLGYHEEMAEALSDVIQKERAHLFQKTNIAVEIGEVISRVSAFIGLHNDNAKGAE
ncbi:MULTISPECIES: hypothetical protein [unclassified Thalassospira]|uniref:hypothetical protein n=1 Tax=unclassified Thalassospira TaxID=2648997 RepID=UPI0007A5BBED|nr:MULTISPECIES: hypothetical protein [unclassified Thalassospira]KZC99939.1 hypothetical protein AUQ41_09805 [Thalassospira sp. MCCC 1A02898]ONH86099.1 hypothetical protein TH47_17895 [Thalassospira sp. MCCC 1A02803]